MLFKIHLDASICLCTHHLWKSDLCHHLICYSVQNSRYQTLPPLSKYGLFKLWRSVTAIYLIKAGI